MAKNEPTLIEGVWWVPDDKGQWRWWNGEHWEAGERPPGMAPADADDGRPARLARRPIGKRERVAGAVAALIGATVAGAIVTHLLGGSTSAPRGPFDYSAAENEAFTNACLNEGAPQDYCACALVEAHRYARVELNAFTDASGTLTPKGLELRETVVAKCNR